MTGDSPSVSRFRLTTVWPCATVRLLERPPEGGALAPLARPLRYRSLFRDLLEGSGTVESFGLPWSDPVEHRFWREYTTYDRDAVPEEIGPRSASRFVVPLHHGSAAADLPDCPPWKLSCHAFAYPFGIGIVLHAEFPHPDPARRGGGSDLLDLEDLVESCYDLRTGGAAQDEDFWERFVRDSVDTLAPEYAAAPGDVGVGAPLTVATFVEADVHRLAASARDRVLNALTVWPDRPVWRNATVPERLEVELGSRHAAEGRLIHAAHRGRAVWFPDGFAAGGSLSEMHRRLYFVTMQTEMLARFLARTAAHQPGLAELPPSWSDWAQEAARAIGPLYAGKIVAADSSSPALQVDASGTKEGVNLVRGHFGLDALH